jgi:hypothetical protein
MVMRDVACDAKSYKKYKSATQQKINSNNVVWFIIKAKRLKELKEKRS